MTVNAFILFFAGMLSELVLLIASANPSFDKTDHAKRIDRIITPSRTIVTLLLLLALLMVGVAQLFHVGDVLVYIDTPVVNLLMVVLGVAIFLAAVFAGLFLPVINEQTILLVQCLLLASILQSGNQVAWLPSPIILWIPAAISLVLVIWNRTFAPPMKALLYLWYLLTILIIPFQNGEMNYFRQNDINLIDGYLFGMLLAFLIVNGFSALRFLLIVSSLALPRNHAMANELMPQLFFDEQVPVLRFLVVAALVAAFLGFNHLTGFIEPQLAFSLGSMLCVQLLSVFAAGR